jgi:hypothetical protein
MNESRSRIWYSTYSSAKAIERLQHQNLEHHHCIKRLAVGVALPLFRQRPHCRLDVRAEALERNDGVKRFERISLRTDRLKTLVEIEKTGLSHRFPPRRQSSQNT